MEWPMIELGSAAEIRGGATPRRSNAAYWSGDIPWVTPTDLPTRDKGIRDVKNTADAITDEGLGACSASLLPPGTVLFSSRASIGKIGIAAVPLTTNQGFANLIPGPHLESRYLAWCLHYHADQIAGLAGSTTFKEVSKRALRRFLIPVPPISEQRRIAEILDQAHRIRHLGAEADAKTDRLLPAFFTRLLRSPGSGTADLMPRPLHELAKFVSGATPSKRIPQYWNGNIPWISPKDVKQDFLSDSRDHVSSAAVEDTRLTVVEAGNPVIVVRGMILARDVPVALTLCPATINQDVKMLVPKTSQVTGTFLWVSLMLAKPHLFSLVQTSGHGTRKLDTSDLMQVPLIVPESEVMGQIDAAVGKLHRLKVQTRQRRKVLDDMYAALVANAFDASLTTSWREAHMSDLLQEMEIQTEGLARSATVG